MVGRICASVVNINGSNFADTHKGRLAMYEYPHGDSTIPVLQFEPGQPFFAVDPIDSSVTSDIPRLLNVYRPVNGMPASISPQELHRQSKIFLVHIASLVFSVAALALTWYTALYEDTTGYCGPAGQLYYRALWMYFFSNAAHFAFEYTPAPGRHILSEERPQWLALGLISLFLYPVFWRTYRSQSFSLFPSQNPQDWLSISSFQSSRVLF